VKTVVARVRTDVVAPKSGRVQAQTVVMVIASGILLVLVAAPLAFLVGRSVLVEGQFTIASYAEVLTRGVYYSSLLNTLWVGLGAAALAMLIGTTLAWGVSRTDMPLRETTRAMVTAAFLFPPFLLAIAYVILWAPNAGVMNTFVAGVFGLPRGPFNAYTLPTLIFVTGLHTFPPVFLLVAAALESVDTSLEQAAQILGASRWRVTLRITLPLVLPSILAGGLLAFVNAIALFGSQAILGIPGRIYTLPTRVYQVLGFPPNYPLAAALSMLLVVLTVLALLVQRRWLGNQTSYATIGGRGGALVIARLRMWRWVLLAFSLLVGLVSVVLPFGSLAAVSLVRSRARGLTLDNLTVDNYVDVLWRLPELQRAIINSLLLGIVSATLALPLGVVVAYIGLRTLTPGRRLLDYLALIPLGLPGIVLAVAILQFWLAIPFVNLYGTYAILVLAYMTRFVPLAVRASSAALVQVDPSLEEAARIGGLSWLGTLRTITLPLVRVGLLAGWILVFVPTIQELSASILLFTPETQTVAVAIFNLQDNGQLEKVGALGIIVVVVVSLGLYFVRRVVGRAVPLQEAP
jgi:iron(III) transport system permease protein